MSNVSQLGVSAAAISAAFPVAGEGASRIPAVVLVRYRGGLLHPGGHAGSDSEKRCKAAVDELVLGWKGAAALHI
jgi:hypothetical protein